jgi:hypothetical protein
MPQVPRNGDFTARVPGHVRDELVRLKDGLPRSFRRPNNGDMVGALILQARRSPKTLQADLATYFEIKDAWAEDGVETLPDL